MQTSEYLLAVVGGANPVQDRKDNRLFAYLLGRVSPTPKFRVQIHGNLKSHLHPGNKLLEEAPFREASVSRIHP